MTTPTPPEGPSRSPARASAPVPAAAWRRFALTFAAILADIEARDARDASRTAAPLRMADDAVRLDTTELDPDAAFDEARGIVERARGDAS